MRSSSFALDVGLLALIFHTAMAMPSIFDDFGPTPRTYDSHGHLHKHHGSNYDSPLLNYPELDYGKASAIHNPNSKGNPGPPIYYAQSPLSVTPAPYGPTPTPLSLIESFVAESSIHHPVNDYAHPVHAHQQYAPANHHYQTTPHPYKADGEAQIDVHSSPDGFSYQVTEERGHGSYSHVSQTRDFTKKSPSYGSKHHAPTPYHPREVAYPAPEPKHYHHNHYPSPHHQHSSYLDPLPSPGHYDEPNYDHPIGGHHQQSTYHGSKPRTYAANGHSSPGRVVHKNHHGKKSSGYKATISHGVRSYVVS